MSIILASNSRYKRAQLLNLGINFQSIAPISDEYHDPTLTASQLAIRLAEQKATEIAKLHPQDTIIGSDQTAVIDSCQTLLFKPGSIPAAIEQLTKCSGRSATFYSAVSLQGPQSSESWVISTQVFFRRLTAEEICRYVELDNPIDCAGSFKIESLGIALFSKIQSEDPTALVGLPLLSLANQLRNIGISIQ